VVRDRHAGEVLGWAHGAHRTGFNIGKPPYGYQVVERHPVPAKAALGKVKRRLVRDPVRGPVVTMIYKWRVVPSSPTARSTNPPSSRRGYGALVLKNAAGAAQTRLIVPEDQKLR
jgi:hypothetical protein